MTYNNPRKACGIYQQTDLTSLTPVQIVARLYEALENDLHLAQKALLDSERNIMGEKLSHALAIIGELQTALDFKSGGEIAENLHSLYNFVISAISKANLTGGEESLNSAINTIQPLAEAWSELAGQKKSSIVPMNIGSRPEAVSAIAFNATF